MSAHTEGHESTRLHLFKIGPPCCGKGYTGDKMKERYPDLYQIRLGDIVRGMMKSGSLTTEQRDIVNKHGGLLPDDMINNILIHLYHDGIESGKTKFEFDGACRTLDQATFLIECARESGINPRNSKFVLFQARKETCVNNACGKNSAHRNGRADDGRIVDRYQLAMKNIPKIVKLLRSAEFKVVEIDANCKLENTWYGYRTYADQLFQRQLITREVRVNHHHSPAFQAVVA